MMLLELLIGWAALAVVFALGWRWSVRHENAGVVDVLWAFTLGALVAWVALWAEGDGGRRLLLAAAVLLWSVRLGWHILRRLRREDEEDGRYQFHRKHWGAHAERNFFFFFQAQALVNLFLALPVALLMANPRGLGGWDLLAILVIIGAVAGERLADAQLAAWKADPSNQGKTCRRGLWAWSRHPNYFFEWIHWCAYPIAGFALFGTPWAWWWPATWIGPAAMLFLLLRATGIPYTEKRALASRGEDYRRYQREVSAFVPWPPKKESSDEQG